MVKLNPPAYIGIIALLIVTNAITATVAFSHHPAATQTHTPSTPTTFKNISDLAKDSSKLMGQVITVHGTIVKSNDNSYYIVGQGQHPTAFRLDFSQSGLNPDKYATNVGTKPTSGKDATSTAYAVYGKLVSGDKTVSLQVQSITAN